MSERTAIYLLKEVYCPEPIRFGMTKVGVSSTPFSRLISLQTGNPHRLVLIQLDWYPSRREALRAERRAHEHLKRFALQGEWFSDNSWLAIEALALAGDRIDAQLFYDHAPPDYEMELYLGGQYETLGGQDWSCGGALL